MAEKPEGKVNIRNFAGQFSGIDPDDMPDGGAAEQVNAVVLISGELMVRSGYRQIQFEDD